VIRVVQLVSLEEPLKGVRDMLAVNFSSLLAHIDVHQVTLQNSVGTGVENANENRRDSVGDNEDNQNGHEGLVNGLSSGSQGLNQEEADEGGAGGDANLTNEHEDGSHAVNHTELNGILESQEESVDGRAAEGLVRESHVNVSILG
jgi:hypothetical protein